MNWNQALQHFTSVLNSCCFTGREGDCVNRDQGFGFMLNCALKVKAAGNAIYFIGNGASASMASHFSVDISKNARIPCFTLTDPSSMTAVSNDINYESVYSDPLSYMLKKNDVLIAISSSGNSRNILSAVRTAQKNEGFVITFSGMNEDNALRHMGDINIFVKDEDYGFVESAHAFILHHWVDRVLDAICYKASEPIQEVARI
ncbi:MAG: SIS domain-containing protein [Coxiellaceae bacterium]|nr:SIS domain-containing protein [Coxiellaceae bacterium]